MIPVRVSSRFVEPELAITTPAGAAPWSFAQGLSTIERPDGRR